MQRTMKRIGALILALAMLVTFMPTLGLTEQAHAEANNDITVYFTISNNGVIAQDNDGEAMAWRPVKVTDLDENGEFTLDEALKAVHIMYNSADGYSRDDTSGWVTSLWGVTDAAGFSFFKNDLRTNIVTEELISNGDDLVASINQDGEIYADWAAYFDSHKKTVAVGETFTLSMKGFPAMTTNTPVAGNNVPIGIWKNGIFEPIDDLVTDEDGEVDLSFDEPGTYIISANGTVNDSVLVDDSEDGLWKLIKIGTINGEVVYGKIDWSTYDSFYAYTEEDYGEGPYPWDEIKYENVEYDDDDNTVVLNNTGYPLYSGIVTSDCPLIAPCCIVKVLPDPIEVTMTVNNKGILASDKDGEAMVERPVTVTDADEDTILTFHDALVAAHKEYYPDGEAGYDPGSGFVDKLWGNESTNNLFYINDEGLPNGVTVDTVAEGDRLYASVNADNMFYSDWFSKFKSSKKTVTAGEDFTLDLTGHKGMAYTEEENTFVPLSGIKVGTWDNGAFNEIEGAVTDDNGKAVLSFAEPGTYIVTANGMVKGTVSDWKLIDLSNNQGWPYGTIDSDAFEYNVAYTDKDYGDGPYPADEVKYIDFFEEADEESDNVYAWQDLHYLKSNQLIANCPIMAPYCVVKVVESSLDDLQAALDKVNAALEEAGQALFDAQSAIDNKDAQISSLTNQLTKAQEELKAAQEALEKAQGEGSEKDAAIADLQAKLTQAQTDLKVAQEALDAAQKAGTDKDSKIKELDGQITKVQDELKIAKETIKVQKKAVKNIKAKGQKKKAKVTWKSLGKGYKYEVFKSTKPTGKFKKAATAKKAKAVVKKLKKGKTFYFKVRGFKKVGGKKVYTQFSDVAKAKIK